MNMKLGPEPSQLLVLWVATSLDLSLGLSFLEGHLEIQHIARISLGWNVSFSQPAENWSPQEHRK